MATEHKELFALARIREITGLGHKPMLSDLPDEIERLLKAKDAEISGLRARLEMEATNAPNG
jgi:hypothetical protein